MRTLQEYDDMYKDYNQEENELQPILIRKGHPDKEDYKELAKFFYGLKHYANSRARFYTFIDEYNNTEYWKPELEVRGVLNFCNYEDYKNYIISKDIKELDTYMDYGSWIITTQNLGFVKAILRLEKEGKVELSYCLYPYKDAKRLGYNFDRAGWHSGYNYFSFTIFLDNKKQFYIVKEVIDREEGVKCKKCGSYKIEIEGIGNMIPTSEFSCSGCGYSWVE